MNKAWRCTARNKDGHRCRHKEGHQEAEKPKYPLHSAFKQSW